jgi:molecular chaperone DnaJ
MEFLSTDICEKLLLLSPGASEEEIKRAYRILAKRYHPDKNPGYEDKFRAITNAYNFLLEHKNDIPEKTSSKEINNLKGSDLKISIKATVEDFATGAKRFIRIKRKGVCNTCNATGSSKGLSNKCKHCAGTGIQGLSLVLGQKKKCLKCGGLGRIPEPPVCTTCGGTGLIDEIVKRNVELNPFSEIITVHGLGNNVPGGKPGDLIIVVEVQKNSKYALKGLDLLMELHVTPTQAVLGDIVQVSLFGKSLSLRIPAGTPCNKIMDFEGGGITYNGKTGKLKCKVCVDIPRLITQEETDLYTKILVLEKNNSLKNLTL